jgi:glycerophosphoryl diester phosphodiesterase
MSRPLVIAHRGASGERPENTDVAFERAIELGADMIETDLHVSRDGVIVIHHDAALGRLGAPGEIRDYTAAELAALDAAPGIPEVARMPTLLDVLERQAPRIDFNLELKVGLEGRRYPGMERRVVEALEGRGLLPRMLLSSFDDEVLRALREASEAARIAVLVSRRAPRNVLKRAQRVAAEAINPHCALVTPKLVAEAHAHGLAVYPYTANEETEMQRLLDCGVDGVITNHPDRLRALLDRRS